MKKRFEVTHGCTLCGMCIYECPVQAIRMEKSGAVINGEVCIGCGACYANCASEAIVSIEIDEV